MPRTPYWKDTLIARQIVTGNSQEESLLGDWTTIDTRGLTLERMVIDLSIAPWLQAVRTCQYNICSQLKTPSL